MEVRHGLDRLKEMSFQRRSEGVGRQRVADVVRQFIPTERALVRKSAEAKGLFVVGRGDSQNPSVSGGAKCT